MRIKKNFRGNITIFIGFVLNVFLSFIFGNIYLAELLFKRLRIPIDIRSPIPVIFVQSVGYLQYRR